MFVIFGTRGITSTVQLSMFHCPRCGSLREGKLKQVRSFFTLYFIPVIPLNVLGRYVECSGCKGTYVEEILQYDPNAQQQVFIDTMAQFDAVSQYVDSSDCGVTYSEQVSQYEPLARQQVLFDQMLRVMVLAALADGVVDADEQAEIDRQYLGLTGLPVTEDKLNGEVGQALGSGVTLNDYVAKIATEYTPQDKDQLIRLAYTVMSAHGPLEDGHRQQLAGLARTLEIPDDQFLGYLRQLREEANELV